MKSQMILVVLALVILSFTISASYGAGTSSPLYSSPQNLTINQTTSLVHETILIAGNASYTVSPSSSPNILFTTSSFKVSKTSGYNFSFYANVSRVGQYFLNFTTNSTVTYSLPIEVVAPHKSSAGYAIEVFGTIASDSQVIIWAKQNGTTVQNGNLFIQYDNISNEISLAVAPYYARVDLPLIYGNVILEYQPPSGATVGPDIFTVANSTALPGTQIERIIPFCNGEETNLASTNNTVQSEYYITPDTNITCSLYSSSYAPLSGVPLQVISNGILTRPYSSDPYGQDTIPAPAGGWTPGTMILRSPSNDYLLSPVLFDVVPIVNPMTVTSSGDQATIDPEVTQSISVTYPNGTKSTEDTNHSMIITAVGKVTITGSAPSYVAFNEQVDLHQISLTLAVKNETTQIYPYMDYIFELWQNNSIYGYTGPAMIGNTQLSFTDGYASGHLQTNNDTTVIPGGQYDVSTGLLASPLPVLLEISGSPKLNTLYTFSLVPLQGPTAVAGQERPINFSGDITMTQGSDTSQIPIVNGVGTVSFTSSTPVVFSINGTDSQIQLPTQTIYPSDPAPFYTQWWFYLIVVSVILVVIFPKNIYGLVFNKGEEGGDTHINM